MQKVKEPFLINPPKRLRRKRRIKRKRKNPIADLMIINRKRRKIHSKKKRGGIKMARKRSKTRRLSVSGRSGRVRVSPLSRLAPRSAGRILNPFASTNRHRMKRKYYRNPALAIPLIGKVDIDLKEIGGGIAGFVLVKTVPSMVFPMNWQVGIMRIASQGLTAIVGSMLAGKFLGKRFGKMVLYGGLIALGSELAGQLLVKVGVPLAQVNGMGLYLTPEQMGYYYQQTEV